jgi:hypothetical protein
MGTEASRQGCRHGFFEEEPYVPATPGPRAFERCREIQAPTCSYESERVLLPPGFVEIDREEETRLVEEQWIHAGDEGLSSGILAREMPANDLIGYRQEAAVGTVGAFDARFLTDTADPLVCAGGCVPGPAAFPALEAARVHIVSTTEEGSEERDLDLGSRRPIDRV